MTALTAVCGEHGPQPEPRTLTERPAPGPPHRPHPGERDRERGQQNRAVYGVETAPESAGLRGRLDRDQVVAAPAESCQVGASDAVVGVARTVPGHPLRVEPLAVPVSAARQLVSL